MSQDKLVTIKVFMIAKNSSASDKDQGIKRMSRHRSFMS